MSASSFWRRAAAPVRVEDEDPGPAFGDGGEIVLADVGVLGLAKADRLDGGRRRALERPAALGAGRGGAERLWPGRRGSRRLNEAIRMAGVAPCWLTGGSRRGLDPDRSERTRARIKVLRAPERKKPRRGGAVFRRAAGWRAQSHGPHHPAVRALVHRVGQRVEVAVGVLVGGDLLVADLVRRVDGKKPGVVLCLVWLMVVGCGGAASSRCR
jgi:hypothetical protein